jgi:dihydrofolate reductase
MPRFLSWAGMGLLTFALNVTLDGCCDHREGVADDALLRYYSRLMDRTGAMLWGRTTYEMMESAWPAIARDPNSAPAFRAFGRKLDAKPKYVVSSARRDFPWNNTFRVEGNLRKAITALKRRTPRGLLVGSPMLSTALEKMGLIDEYRIAVHPVVAGHGPAPFAGLRSSFRLTLVDTKRFESGVIALHYRKRQSGPGEAR